MPHSASLESEFTGLLVTESSSPGSEDVFNAAGEMTPGVSISLQVEGIPLLQRRLTVETQKHLFLQHIMLALTELQKSHLHQTGAPLQTEGINMHITAWEHQIAASNLFQRSVQSITDQNWVAVLAFAGAVLVFHFEQMRRAVPGTVTIEDMVESVLVLHSAAQLGEELRPFLTRSGLPAIIQRRLQQDAPAWDSAAEQAIADIHKLNTVLCAGTTEEWAVCEDAIMKLEFWLRLVHCHPRTWLHIVWWPGMISTEFIALLSQGHHVALVILLHWCAVMASGPKRWFLDGWAQTMALPALQCLGPQLADATDWACFQLKIDPKYV